MGTVVVSIQSPKPDTVLIQRQNPEESSDSRCYKLVGPFFLALSLLYTLTCSLFAYRMSGDLRALASLLLTYSSLLPLVMCVHLFLTTPDANAAKWVGLRAAIWAFSTALVVVFFGRLLPALPVAPAIAAYTLAGLIVVLNFFVLFISPVHKYGVDIDSSYHNSSSCKA